MAVGTPVLLDSGGTDTDARDYSSANTITPTLGRTVLAAVAIHDLGSQLGGPTLSGWGLTWTLVSGIGGSPTEPALYVWRASGPAVSAGVLTFAGCCSVGQTCDGAAWMMVEIPNTDVTTRDGVIQYIDTGHTGQDSFTVTLGAFRDAESATCAFVQAYDNAGGAMTLTAGSGFTMLPSPVSQASGGDTILLGFQYKLSNDTTVDVSVTSPNDSMNMLPMEIGHWRPRPSGIIAPSRAALIPVAW